MEHPYIFYNLSLFIVFQHFCLNKCSYCVILYTYCVIFISQKRSFLFSCRPQESLIFTIKSIFYTFHFCLFFIKLYISTFMIICLLSTSVTFFHKNIKIKTFTYFFIIFVDSFICMTRVSHQPVMGLL